MNAPIDHFSTSLVLVPMPSGEFLALSQDAFAEARALGQRMAGRSPAVRGDAASITDEPLLTAEQMEERTSIPATWFLEQARKEALPHIRAGKYVRFRFSELREACKRKAK
jgi:hypothetical protein